jgi:hypothetical protein
MASKQFLEFLEFCLYISRPLGNKCRIFIYAITAPKEEEDQLVDNETAYGPRSTSNIENDQH